MVERTTVDAVMAIMDIRVDETKVPSFITTSNLIINKIEPSYEGEQDAEALLEQIEKYYAAHLLTVSLYQKEIQIKGLDTDTRYSDVYDEGLDASPYGQILKTLDYKNVLEGLSKRKVMFQSINTDKSTIYPNET